MIISRKLHNFKHLQSKSYKNSIEKNSKNGLTKLKACFENKTGFMRRLILPFSNKNQIQNQIKFATL